MNLIYLIQVLAMCVGNIHHKIDKCTLNLMTTTTVEDWIGTSMFCSWKDTISEVSFFSESFQNKRISCQVKVIVIIVTSR